MFVHQKKIVLRVSQKKNPAKPVIRKKNFPLPHHFSKKKYTFYFWGWAIFLNNTISAINLLPVSFASIALHYIFWRFFFVQEFFRQLPTTTTPHRHHPNLRSYPPSLIFRRGEGGHDTFTCRIICYKTSFWCFL